MRKRHNLIVRKELLLNFHELMGIKYTSWTSQATRSSEWLTLKEKGPTEEKDKTIWTKIKDKYCSIRPQTESHV